jgi:hypothetical protein
MFEVLHLAMLGFIALGIIGLMQAYWATVKQNDEGLDLNRKLLAMRSAEYNYWVKNVAAAEYEQWVKDAFEKKQNENKTTEV